MCSSVWNKIQHLLLAVRILQDLQAVVWFSWRRRCGSYMGEPKGISDIFSPFYHAELIWFLFYISQKRGREEADEAAPEPTSILKEVGDVGKGLVRGVYLVKAPKFQ